MLSHFGTESLYMVCDLCKEYSALVHSLVEKNGYPL